MFDNIGNKIRVLAFATCIIGIVASIIGGIALMGISSVTGLIVIAAGALCSWVGSFVLYGFGELICNTDKMIEQNTALEKKLDSIISASADGKDEKAKTSSAAKASVQDVKNAETLVMRTETQNVQEENPGKTIKCAVDEAGKCKCSKCGAVQNGNRSRCWECGALFDN